MGACRTIDPARQARRQQASCRGARSDERDHVYFEHGMPVACDPERSAAAQHTFRLSRLVELRRHAGSQPLTRPQTVTSCAITLPSICAPSPIRRSEARNSPLIRPKTCAGPLHSILPTIDMPEPMQELVPDFVIGSRPRGCSTTECCCCTALPTTSSKFAAVL